MNHIVNSPGSNIFMFPTAMLTGDKIIFNNTSAGSRGTVIDWIVPFSGAYQVEAWGAEGGSSSSYGSGGRGARMRGTFNFIEGERIKILVGQQGGRDSAGGGGGGTFVVSSGDVPLIVAGGGGGRSVYNSSVTTMDATTSTTGRNSSGSSAKGGTSGLGGQSQNQHSGGGGGGFFGNGYSVPAVSQHWGEGGRSFISGGRGGEAYYSYTSGVGGFGGGGRSGHNGGGGGGYSGGAGGFHSSQGAGGGGSYNAGNNQNNSSAVWRGHGKVEITVISLQNADLKINELSISKSYINEAFNEALLLKARAEHPKGETKSINCTITVNGSEYREYNTVLPFSLDLYVPTQLLTLQHNEIMVAIMAEDESFGMIQPINIYKEGRDTFSIVREMGFDRSHPISGNVERIPFLGYGVAGEGSGETIVSIPTDGKSKIISIATKETGGFDRSSDREIAIKSHVPLDGGYMTESFPILTTGLRKITGLGYRRRE